MSTTADVIAGVRKAHGLRSVEGPVATCRCGWAGTYRGRGHEAHRDAELVTALEGQVKDLVEQGPLKDAYWALNEITAVVGNTGIPSFEAMAKIEVIMRTYHLI